MQLVYHEAEGDRVLPPTADRMFFGARLELSGQSLSVPSTLMLRDVEELVGEGVRVNKTTTWELTEDQVDVVLKKYPVIRR